MIASGHTGNAHTSARVRAQTIGSTQGHGVNWIAEAPVRLAWWLRIYSGRRWQEYELAERSVVH